MTRPMTYDSQEIAEAAAWRRRDIGDTIKAIDALVAAEREACAKAVESIKSDIGLGAASRAAAAIRNRQQ